MAETPVLILTGPVGVGKTAVAAQVSDLLNAQGLAHAVIDMDWMRWCHPAPADDPFHLALGLRNLAAVWAAYRAAGASRLVLVDIVETRATLRTYWPALPDADLHVVRLTAALPTILRRLDGRESGASLAWHQARAAELLQLMDAQAVEDILVSTEGQTVEEVARAVLAQIGWLHPAGGSSILVI